MTEPEFDKDGYPTEKTLEYIQGFEIFDKSFAGVGPGARVLDLMEFCKKAWRWPENFKVNIPERNARVSTGGWSGNEDVISALQRNEIFWAIFWEESRRGGHYIFNFNGFL